MIRSYSGCALGGVAFYLAGNALYETGLGHLQAIRSPEEVVYSVFVSLGFIIAIACLAAAVFSACTPLLQVAFGYLVAFAAFAAFTPAPWWERIGNIGMYLGVAAVIHSLWSGACKEARA